MLYNAELFCLRQFQDAAGLTISELERVAGQLEADFVTQAVTPVCQQPQADVLTCYT